MRAPATHEDVRRADFQEAIVGLDLRITSAPKTKLFYDLLMTHRSHPGWHRNHLVGLVFTVRR